MTALTNGWSRIDPALVRHARRVAACAVFDLMAAGRKVPLRAFIQAAEIITTEPELLARYRHHG